MILSNLSLSRKLRRCKKTYFGVAGVTGRGRGGGLVAAGREAGGGVEPGVVKYCLLFILIYMRRYSLINQEKTALQLSSSFFFSRNRLLSYSGMI